MLAGRAGDLLCIDAGGLAVMPRRRVLLLRIDVDLAHLDGIELIAPDAPVENFLRARGGVEAPHVALLHDGNRHRPVFVADVQNALRRADAHQGGALRVGHEKNLAIALVHDRIARLNHLFCVGSEKRDELARCWRRAHRRVRRRRPPEWRRSFARRPPTRRSRRTAMRRPRNLHDRCDSHRSCSLAPRLGPDVPRGGAALFWWRDAALTALAGGALGATVLVAGVGIGLGVRARSRRISASAGGAIAARAVIRRSRAGGGRALRRGPRLRGPRILGRPEPAEGYVDGRGGAASGRARTRPRRTAASRAAAPVRRAWGAGVAPAVHIDVVAVHVDVVDVDVPVDVDVRGGVRIWARAVIPAVGDGHRPDVRIAGIRRHHPRPADHHHAMRMPAHAPRAPTPGCVVESC